MIDFRFFKKLFSFDEYDAKICPYKGIMQHIVPFIR